MPQTAHELDLYRRRTYGVTSEEYDARLKEQDGKCAICGRAPKVRALNIDHSHWLVKRKIKTIHSRSGDFFATIEGFVGQVFQGLTNAAAKALAFTFLKRKSWRGLICGDCNRGLRLFRDNGKEVPDVAIANLRRAAAYLEAWKQREQISPQ